MQVVAAYAAATVALVMLDLLWVGLVGRTLARRGRASQPGRHKLGLGMAVYGLLAFGLLLLAFSPPQRSDAEPSNSQRSSSVAAAAAPT